MLDNFDIHITFDADGKVNATLYSDGDGCGHTQQIDIQAKVANLVDYHLEHYRRSHKQVPKQYCRFTLAHPQVDNIEFYCVLEPHTNEDHELRTRKVSK